MDVRKLNNENIVSDDWTKGYALLDVGLTLISSLLKGDP